MNGQWADVTHNVVSMRAAPNSGSEQVSQAISGDAVEIMETEGEYARVRGRDGYEGWSLLRLLAPCAREECIRAGETAEMAYVRVPFADFTTSDGELVTRLVFGTPIRVLRDAAPDGDTLMVRVAGSAVGCIRAAELTLPGAPLAEFSQIGAIARLFLGTPYLWGGVTPYGFDCSGLVQRVYEAVGLQLPRDADQQAQSGLGRLLPESAPLLAGDLIFFRGVQNPRKRGITHVGMMLDAVRMIHAYGKAGVMVDLLAGDEITGAYTFHGVWRVW